MAATKSKAIIALGLNPAWQKTLTFEEFRPGEVNRAISVEYAASGKGVNFVRAARQWGQEARIFQFAGGETGQKLCAELDKEGLPHETIRIATETRVCNTCLCRKTKSMTELIEPSGTVSPNESEQLLKKVVSSMREVSALALCGTFPPGISAPFYAEAALAAKRQGLTVFLDAWKDIGPALQAGVDILKINREELASLSSENEVSKGITASFDRYPMLRIIAITAGGQEAQIAERGGKRWILKIPRLENLINPLGAGDTSAAIFLSEFLAGAAVPEAFAAGLGAASASCLHLKCAVFSREQAKSFAGKILESIKECP
ncbi:MAG: hypothetical protein A2X49_16940 [Lentisphaerae bacterium GWF2_52_8]|nr:MAG: hypothetical protein A2X49_16940 [Lentisphaerae bacterium GWF2_52_8]